MPGRTAGAPWSDSLAKRRPEDLPHSRPWVELMVYEPNGTRRLDVRIGDNHAHTEFRPDGLPTHHLRLAEDGLEFEVRFGNELPSWMPGRGETHFGGGDSFGWAVGAPRATVSGTVIIDGVRSEVTGRGDADHNWGVGDMRKIIERWHWGRLCVEDYSLLFADVLTQRRRGVHEIAPLMLAHHDRIVLSTGEMRLREGPGRFDTAAGRAYPEWIELSVPDQVELRLNVERVIHAHDLLDDIPLAGSRLLKPLVHTLIGHPGYFRFESAFELTVHGDGLPVRRTGTTLHELVALA